MTDREYLVFQFAPDGTGDEIGDELDSDSIDIGDFYVEGFSILSYIHPTDEEGNDFDKDAGGNGSEVRPALQGVRQTRSRTGERREA